MIFDWDDTLFPTTTIMAAKRQHGKEGVLRLHGANLERHAQVLEELLRTAASQAKVAIVTLAGRGWVESSAAKYLPGLNFSRLILELNIEVYYASDCQAEDYVGMKMAAMSQAINAAYAQAADGSQRLNVLSIGDSAVERSALQELLSLWSASGALVFSPHSKTLKLQEDPDLKTIGEELASIQPCLRQLMSHAGDLDVVVDSSEELCAALNSLSAPRDASHDAPPEFCTVTLIAV